MVMYRDQNAGQNHNINIGIKCSERVEQGKYLGTNVTYQNSIMIRLTTGMLAIIRCRTFSFPACYPKI